jgi:hypothetical protein
MLQAQLQMQLLGKGNVSAGKDGTASVSTGSSLNPPCTVPAVGQFSSSLRERNAVGMLNLCRSFSRQKLSTGSLH